MKADARALRQLDPAVRLILLYGANTSASADLARTLFRQFPDADGETIFAAATLTTDPAALVSAACEIAMFGGSQPIRVDDAGEEVFAAVAQVLDAAIIEHPVVIVAGALKKGSKLVACVEGDARGLAVVSYLPDAVSTAATISQIAAEHGLRLSRDAVTAMAQTTGGDRGILRQEIIKLALYVDAALDSRCAADVADVKAIVADFADADLGELVDGVASGDPAAVGRQLAEFDASAVPGITLLRAVARRFWLLLDLRAAVDGGASATRAVDAVRPPVFWKNKPVVAAQVARWQTDAVRSALDRLFDAERAIKRSGSAGDIAVGQLLLALANQRRGEART